MAVTIPALESIKTLFNALEQLEYRYEYLKRLHSEVDGTLVDIDHYLELEKINAVERSKLAAIRMRVLRRRREIKDEISLVTDLKAAIPIKSSTRKEWIDKKVDTLNSRVYTPRQKTLSELLSTKSEDWKEEI